MRKLILLMLCAIVTNEFFAQEAPVSSDSLERRAVHFENLRQTDSAAYYFRKAAASFLAENDLIGHFRMINEAADQIHRAGRFDESINMLLKIIQDAKDVKGGNIVFHAYVDLAIHYSERNLDELAENHYNLALENFENLGTKESVMALGKALIGLGVVYGRRGFIPKAADYFQQAANAYDTANLVHMDVAINYYNLANIAQRIGALKESEEFLEKSLDMRVKLNVNPDDPSFALIYMALGSIASDLHFNQRAVDHLNRALRISLKMAPRDFYTPFIKEYLADTYLRMGEFDTSLELRQQILQSNQKQFGPNHGTTGKKYYLIGKHYTDTGDFEKAIENLDKAIQIYSKLGNPYDLHDLPQAEVIKGINQIKLGLEQAGMTNIINGLTKLEEGAKKGQIEIMTVYMNVADAFLELGRYHDALSYYQQAMFPDLSDLRSKDFTKNIGVIGHSDVRNLFPLLINKAGALEQQWKIEGDDKLLHAAYSAILSADSLSNELKSKSNIFKDQLSYQNIISEVNTIGLSLSHSLYEQTSETKYLRRAFLFSEKNKGNLTLLKVQENILLEQSTLPDSVIGRAQDYQANISYLEAELFRERAQNDSSKIEYYENRLFQFRKEEEEFLINLRTNYPNFYSAKYSQDYEKIEQLQSRNIGKDELLISYHVDAENLYAFNVSSNNVSLIKTPVDSTFKDDLKQFLLSLRSPSQNEPSLKEMYSQSHEFAQILLPDNDELTKYKKLTIVPDNLLALLPFETLITNYRPDVTASKDPRYLIQDYSISYASSVTLLSRQKNQQKGFRNEEVIAFAPVFEGNGLIASTENDTIRAGLGALAWTQTEVNNISNYFKTKSLLGKEATERQFRESSSNHSIIHVASHGLLNEEYPMFSKLVFSPYDTDSINDGYLNTQELFNMNIPANMVVLSACNTGLGEVISGEGVLSLASGFFYAGAKSLAMTLWTANDQSTSVIMNSFYKNLADGQTKGGALRNAKLAHLEAADPLTSHPYYWAHLVVNGNNDPIVEPSMMWIYILIIGALLAAMLWQARMKRRVT